MPIKVISPKDKYKLNVIKAGPQPKLSVAKPQVQPKLSVAKPQVQPKLTVSPTPTAPKVSAQPTGNLSATNPRPTLSSGPSTPATPRDTFVNNLASAQAPALTAMQQQSKNALGSFQAASQLPTPQAPQAPATPKTPTFTQPSDEAFRNAYQNYLTSLEPSKEVQAARQRYLDFVTSANLGISDLEGQGRGIPLGLVRGQQGKLAEQAEIQAQRLQGDVDLASGFQGQAQTAAKARADFESSMLARQQPTLQTVGDNIVRINPQTGQAETIYSTPSESTKPIVVPEGSRLVNPQTGEVITSSSQKPVTQTVGGSLLQYDTQTGQWGIIYSDPKEGSGKIARVNGVDYWDDGQGNLSEIKTPVTSESQAQNQLRITQLQDKVSQLDELIDNVSSAGGGVVGPNFFARLSAGKQLTGTEQNFVGSVKQLISQETLDTLINLKEAGGTLGALSDQERVMLQNAATRLGSWELKDSQGFGKGVWNVSEDKFKEELERIRTIAQRAIDRASGVGGGGTITRESLQQEFPQATPQEIEALYQEELGKGNDLSRSENGSVKAAEAIGQYESGGNYKARGPMVTGGQYKGERAMGKYQIMPGNLPSWSKQALGRVVTEKEFMANPTLQDQIAQFKIGKLLEQYGNIQDVASVWFSGRPLAKAGNAKDVLGTTVPQYVKNVEAIFNRIG